MDLPTTRSVLLLCDPVWYAGKPVPEHHLKTIAEWQCRTGSFVFVDGSFQYMKWNDSTTHECTALLNPAFTFRLLCPAKTLAVPFFRFAYLLHPASVHTELLFIYESMVGGANIYDLAFAYRALSVLSNEEGLGRILPELYRRTFLQLVEQNVIRTEITPECGYFVFAVPVERPVEMRGMDETYFQAEGYPDYCRINLMAARRIYGLDTAE